jgi:hypothetical protein
MAAIVLPTLPSDCHLLFGINWCEYFSPDINWKEKTLELNRSKISSNPLNKDTDIILANMQVLPVLPSSNSIVKMHNSKFDPLSTRITVLETNTIALTSHVSTPPIIVHNVNTQNTKHQSSNTSTVQTQPNTIVPNPINTKCHNKNTSQTHTNHSFNTSPLSSKNSATNYNHKQQQQSSNLNPKLNQTSSSSNSQGRTRGTAWGNLGGQHGTTNT